MQKHEFNRMKLFCQIIIPCIALLFSCNQMRLPHVNSSGRFCVCALLLTFNSAIFANTNLVEITLPKSLDRFQALVYD